MKGVRCPDCGGTRLQRYGKTKAGLQKYLCRSITMKNLDGKSSPSEDDFTPVVCRRQFVAGSEHRLDPDKKKIVLGLLAQDTPPKAIAAAVEGISLRWIQELRRRTK